MTYAEPSREATKSVHDRAHEHADAAEMPVPSERAFHWTVRCCHTPIQSGFRVAQDW